MVMPVSYLNALEPVLVPHSQRASAGIAELSDRTGGVVFVFDVQVHGPVVLLLAVLRHRGGLSSRSGSPRKRHHLEIPNHYSTHFVAIP